MNFFKLTILVLFLFSTSSYCQEEEPSDSTEVEITKIGIGVKAGFNFATVSKGNLKNAPDSRPGLYLGITYEYPIIENILSIQPEIIYSQQGFVKQYSVLGERYRSKYNIDYLTIPFLARYYVVRGFSFDVGPEFSFRLNDDFKRDENTDSETEFLTKSNPFDMGFSAGLSFQFQSGLFINGRYNRGFVEIIEKSKAKNTVIQFGLGYKF